MRKTASILLVPALLPLLAWAAFAQTSPTPEASPSASATGTPSTPGGFPPPFVRPYHTPPQEFDARWEKVHPRTAEGVYPNEPADWKPMANPRFEVPAGQPLKGLKICVDAGHGGQAFGPTHGYTGGTRGRVSGLSESDANLRVAFFLWDVLTQAGAEVTMTRLGPNRMSDACTSPTASEAHARNRQEELYSRVQIAQQAGCDYFICIHHNDARVNYVSCYYFETRQWDDAYRARPPYVRRYPDEALNRESYEMAIEIQNALSRCLNLRVIDPAREWSDNYYGHGVPSHNIVVMRESKIPVVLCEISMMSDREEDLRLNDPARAKQAAKGIFEGILANFTYRPMTRWSERPLAGPPGPASMP